MFRLICYFKANLLDHNYETQEVGRCHQLIENIAVQANDMLRHVLKLGGMGGMM